MSGYYYVRLIDYHVATGIGVKAGLDTSFLFCFWLVPTKGRGWNSSWEVGLWVPQHWFAFVVLKVVSLIPFALFVIDCDTAAEQEASNTNTTYNPSTSSLCILLALEYSIYIYFLYFFFLSFYRVVKEAGLLGVFYLISERCMGVEISYPCPLYVGLRVNVQMQGDICHRNLSGLHCTTD